MNKITVVGIGYVGLSISILLSKNNEVTCLDINEDKIKDLNNGISPINDDEVSNYLSNKNLNLQATLDAEKAYSNADFVIIATPTDYDDLANSFNTSSVEQVIKDAIKFNPNIFIIIKSTVPVGYTAKIKNILNFENIIFSPEFLREGHALNDNLYPSRIVIGGECDKSKTFAKLLEEASLKKDIEICFMQSTEAEAVKLFSNAYLAMRVSYFNELDSYGMMKSLNVKQIIKAVCLDERIGNNYNNPSFGYGGYCLPKDTKQLLANFSDVPQDLMQAIVSSNSTRKAFIADQILNLKPQTVGIYKLSMKQGSENSRSASILEVIEKLRNNGISILIFDPTIIETNFDGIEVEKNIKDFIKNSNIIVANRLDAQIMHAKDKIFTRDIFRRDI
jgi:UDPglucose 6-dehydrogenase